MDCPYSFHKDKDGAAVLRCKKFNNSVVYRDTPICEDMGDKDLLWWKQVKKRSSTILKYPKCYPEFKKLLSDAMILLNTEYNQNVKVQERDRFW